MKTRLLFILLLLNFTAFAQVSGSDSPYSVKTTLSNDFVLIGDRVGLTISVLVPESCKVTFPALSDSLMKGIELVSKPTFETVKLKNKQNEQILKLLITSFDSGSYQLPELKIAVTDGSKTDTILSKPLKLVVNTIPRDKAVKDIMDIKPPIEEPLTIKEVAPWAFGGLLLAGLIFLLIIYLKRRRENRPFSFLQKRIDPPHVIALRELEKIKEEKLYTSENHKYYYTRLIDTLRIYIEGRYEVNAMEQTTDEILFGLKGVGFPVDEQYTQLQETLTLADLVKFAKYTPFVSDNENSLKVAFDFVEKTKPLEEVKETVIIEEIKNDKVEEAAELSNVQDNKTLRLTMNQLVFAHPKFLYLLLLVPAMVAWYIFRQKDSKASLQISTLQSFAKAPVSIKVYLRHLLFALRAIVVTLIIIVLARPQSTNTWKNITTEGIDIILAIDVSGSMLARDFTPDRLEAAKEIGIKFISGRQTDRMGLVVFSGESFTLCPLTTDHASLINMFKDIKMGILEDGTAIGSGLAVATSRLKESTAISRVVILLTDGVNNRGEIAPLTAAEIAKSYGVRVYPVGIGSIGTAPYPVQTPFGVQYQDMEVKIDEEMLQQVADMTGGKYFRATNNKALEQVYAEIDKLERSKIDVVEHNKREERFRIFGFIALALIALEFALRTTIFRSIP